MMPLSAAGECGAAAGSGPVKPGRTIRCGALPRSSIRAPCPAHTGCFTLAYERVAVPRALETPLANVITTAEIEDIRFVRPDVAIVASIKHVSDEREASLRDGPGATLPPSSGWLTYVVVKEQDAWRIVSAQTTPIRN